jgi:hypothetical protein
MVAASYISDGIEYSVTPIVDYSHIDSDIEVVHDRITDTSLEYYEQNMEDSVDQNLAFSVLKDGTRVGFVYMRMEGYKYIGACVYIHSDAISSIVGLKTIFDMNDSHKVLFTPHENGLKYFKSMATGPSIRAYHATGTPLTIKRDTVYTKGVKIFKYLGVVNG